jgi:YtoQ family protein
MLDSYDTNLILWPATPLAASVAEELRGIGVELIGHQATTGGLTAHRTEDDQLLLEITHEHPHGGEILIGAVGENHTRDHVGAGINAIRSSVALRHADIVLAHFTLDQRSYPDWTSAYEAGRAVTLGKPLIVMHDPVFDHALKELDRAALAVTRTPTQLVTVLAYVLANDEYSHQQSDEEDGS